MNKTEFSLPAFAAHDEIRELFSTWDRWRGDKLFPSRLETNLKDIGTYLEAVVLFEVHNHDDLRIRYFGSMLMDFFGKDYTGRNYKDLTPEGFWPTRSKRLMGLVETPCASVWTTRGISYGVEQEFSVGASFPVASKAAQAPDQILQICLPYPGMERPVFEPRPTSSPIELADRYSFVDIGAGVGDSSVAVE